MRMMRFNMNKKEEKLAMETILFKKKIESMQQELETKSKQIFKLELEVSKFNFKSKPKLSICNVACQNIPPTAYPCVSPKPHIPKIVLYHPEVNL